MPGPPVARIEAMPLLEIKAPVFAMDGFSIH
jgi:hypothetical protein